MHADQHPEKLEILSNCMREVCKAPMFDVSHLVKGYDWEGIVGDGVVVDVIFLFPFLLVNDADMMYRSEAAKDPSQKPSQPHTPESTASSKIEPTPSIKAKLNVPLKSQIA